jgi:hypothetical protein
MMTSMSWHFESPGTSSRIRVFAALAAVLLAGNGPQADPISIADRYALIPLNGPDETNFQPHAINSRGQIVGELFPTVASLQKSTSQAALRDEDGRYTVIEHPEGKLARLLGINASGKILGSAVDEKWSFGFVREPDGRFSKLTLDVPDAVVLPTSINDEGAILGVYHPRGGLLGPSSVVRMAVSGPCPGEVPSCTRGSIPGGRSSDMS